MALMNLYHAMGSQGAPFTPASIPGLIVWIDPSVSSSVHTTAGLVTQVDDLSGNGNNFIADTGKQPTISAGFFNGHDGLNFSTGTQAMYINSITLPAYTTAVMVLNGSATIAPGCLFFHGTTVGSDGFFLYTDRPSWEVVRGANVNDDNNPGWYNPGVSTAYSFSYGASAQQILVNNVPFPPFSPSGSLVPNTNYTDILTIMSQDNGSRVILGGVVGPVLLYNNQISSANSALLQSYFSANYGI